MKDRVMVYVDENGEIDLKAFDQLLDISKVEYYAITEQSGGAILIHFYDKDENPILPFAR